MKWSERKRRARERRAREWWEARGWPVGLACYQRPRYFSLEVRDRWQAAQIELTPETCLLDWVEDEDESDQENSVPTP